MYFKLKKVSPFVLVVTSLICSRTMFVFFDDPEGPNLLVVAVMASIIYTTSLATYSWVFLKERKLAQILVLPLMDIKSILGPIGTQIVLTTLLYFCL